MVHVLFPVDIILQENLRLVVHLGINVLTQQAANQTQTSKCQGSERGDLESVGHSPLVGRTGRRHNVIGL